MTGNTRRLNDDLITDMWDDLLRVAAPVKGGHATAALVVGFQVRRTGQITSSQPALQPQKPHPFEGRIMHQTGPTRNQPGQAPPAAIGTTPLRHPAQQATSANTPV